MPKSNRKINILLTGGGTLGPVVPLMAMVEAQRQSEDIYEYEFVGTKNGPEEELVKRYEIPFHTLPVAKWRRYLSWQNAMTPLNLAVAFWQARKYLKTLKPDVVVAAGGYVAVPVVWAARLQKIPSLIYQLDVERGLANKLMTKSATSIAVAFRHHVYEFPRAKTTHVGLVVRPSLLRGSKKNAATVLGLSQDRQTIFILGGGTGAKNLNHSIQEILPRLLAKRQVIHLTGVGKAIQNIKHIHYHQHELMNEEIAEAYRVADVVISRGGLSTISELAALGKVSLIIPMYRTHQEANAEFLRRHSAAGVISEHQLASDKLYNLIHRLLTDTKLRKHYQKNIKKLYQDDGLKKMMAIIEDIVK